MTTIVVAYGWQISTHFQDTGLFLLHFGFSSQLLSFLVFVSLIFIVVRAVQAEPLVGDRTRGTCRVLGQGQNPL